MHASKQYPVSGWHSSYDSATAEDVKRYLAEGADPNAWDGEGCTPLHWAAGSRDASAVMKVLLDAGANPNAHTSRGQYTPLHLALTPSEVKVLGDHGADPNARNHLGRTRLHSAALTGETELVVPLVNIGADPNVRDDEGCTPLHLAAAGYAPSVVKALLDAGADPKARDFEGGSPLT